MATLLLGGLLALGSTSREAWAQHSTGTGAVMVAPGDASAPGRDAPKPIAWRFRTFDMSDYAITGAALTVTPDGLNSTRRIIEAWAPRRVEFPAPAPRRWE